MNDEHDPLPLIRAQWANPGDIFSLLLLVGGEVVQKAIARLVGAKFKLPYSRYQVLVTPVAFSFGWVGYALSTLTAAAGNNRLMPAPECTVKVVNCENGFVRDSESWILNRLVKDQEFRVFEEETMHQSTALVGDRVSLLIDTFIAESQVTKEGDEVPPAITPVWWISWAPIVLQFVLAWIPWKLYGNWSIFLLTALGTVMALGFASIRQWSD